MLADAVDVEPDLVRELHLLDQITKPLSLHRGPGPGRRLRHVSKRVDPDFHSAMPQRYPIRSSRGTRLGMNVPLPRAISRPSPSTSTPSPMISRLERLTMVPRAVMTPAEIGRRK